MALVVAGVEACTCTFAPGGCLCVCSTCAANRRPRRLTAGEVNYLLRTLPEALRLRCVAWSERDGLHISVAGSVSVDDVLALQRVGVPITVHSEVVPPNAAERR